jgi:hypothetical protein
MSGSPFARPQWTAMAVRDEGLATYQGRRTNVDQDHPTVVLLHDFDPSYV